MKYFFGINTSSERSNTRFDGDDFIVKNITSDREEAFNTSLLKKIDLINKAKMPVWMRVTEWVSSFIFIFTFAFYYILIKTDFFAEIKNKADLLGFVGLVFIFVFVIILVISKRRNRTLEEDNENQNVFYDIDEATKKAFGLPQNVILIDFYAFPYSLKNGNIDKKCFKSAFNLEINAFESNGNLLFADIDSLYSIPINSITQIKRIDEEVMASVWNKEKYIDDEEFSKYELDENCYNQIISKYHYSISINKDGETYQLFIPLYEIDAFLSLTGLTVSDEEMCITE